MSFVTPNVALIVFLCVLVAAAFISFRTNPNTFTGSKLQIFISCLAGLGIFVTFLFYYSVVELQQEDIRINVIKQTARVNDLFINTLLKEMLSSSELIPNFVLSMMPLNSCGNFDVPPVDVNSVRACIEKFSLSYKIFTIWQDTINSNDFIKIEAETYISNFLQRAHSEELERIWKNNRLNFDEDTQILGDLLFQYSKEIVEQTSESYIEAAKKLMADEKYKQLELN